MEDLFVVFLALHLPVLIVCGVFYKAGKFVQAPRLRPWLRISAVAWFGALWSWYTFMVVPMPLCSGNMLYGYANCTGVPEVLANASLPVFVILTGAALVYGSTLAIVAGAIEWRHRRRPADHIA